MEEEKVVESVEEVTEDFSELDEEMEKEFTNGKGEEDE